MAESLDLEELQKECWKIAEEHGWHQKVNGQKKTTEEIFSSIPEMCALLHSEVSEILEEARKPEPSWNAIGLEFADIFIRLCDYASQLHLDLATEVEKKMEINRSRPYRHGGKRF